MYRHVASTATAATGRLTTNTHRHPNVSVSTPPTSGPTALPSPATPSTRPPASPALAAGSAANVMPSTAGHMIAPPTPIKARAASRTGQRRGDRRDGRERSEDPGAPEEQLASPVQVAQPATGDDEHAEHEGVAVDHPLHGAEIRVEVALDVGERDAQRREVVGDQEDAERHRHQGDERSAIESLVAGVGHRAAQHIVAPRRRLRPDSGRTDDQDPDVNGVR